jgi:hypothetical protein
MLHCLRYLGGTTDVKLHFRRDAPHQLLAYTDADYARCKGTRKSVSGAIFQYAGGPVRWFSKKQDCVTLSATESEYVAMSARTRDVIWLRYLLKEYDMEDTVPTPLYVDNMGALHQSKEYVITTQSRHVVAMMGFVREQQIDFKRILVIHQPCEGQIADFLTKPLPRDMLEVNMALAGQKTRPLNAPSPPDDEEFQILREEDPEDPAELNSILAELQDEDMTQIFEEEGHDSAPVTGEGECKHVAICDRLCQARNSTLKVAEPPATAMDELRDQYRC